MVEAIIDIGFIPVEMTPPVPSWNSSGDFGHSLLLPAILNEIVRLLGAEGAGFIKYNPDLKKLHLEYGSGEWKELTGAWLDPVGNITNMISSTGQVEFNNPGLTVAAHLIHRQSPQTKVLAYTPLFNNGYNLGSIWIGHRRRLTTYELMVVKSMGDVLAQAIYCLRPDRQKEAVSLVTIQSLVDVLAAWDVPTYQHSLRLISSARATARRLGCTENEIQTIGWAALLHDLGKICIPKDILNKPGPLDEAEWDVIRKHPQYGAKILGAVDKLRQVAAIILTHHEKYDGTGYPAGIGAENIPLGARVISVADAYCSMTEDHVYRRTFTHEEAVQEIRRCSGSQFDPVVAESFLSYYTEDPIQSR